MFGKASIPIRLLKDFLWTVRSVTDSHTLKPSKDVGVPDAPK